MNTQTELLNEREAARRLCVSISTIRRRRLHRQPPVWVKVGSRVLYRRQDLESFINASVVRLPEEAGAEHR
jgi:Helix-turn-helix domain